MDMATLNQILQFYSIRLDWWERQLQDYQAQIIAAYQAGIVKLPPYTPPTK